MFALFVAIVFLIVYGSLYPWRFIYFKLPASPLWILLHAWGATKDRRFVADVIINLALYMPLGASGYLAFRRFRIAGPILAGTLVSATVEMLQLFTLTRYCSGFDLVNNIAGSALGVAWAAWFEKAAGPQVWRIGLPRGRDRGALALLFCWIGVLVFPLYPEMHLVALRADISAFVHSPVFVLVPFVSALGIWFVAGRLLVAAGVERANVWLALSLLLLPAQFLIITRQPMPSEMLGALAGYLLFVGTGGFTDRWLAGSFLVLLAVRGLAPFHLSAAHTFHWLPFQGFMKMEGTAGAGIMLEKIFFYGCAVWLLRAVGWRWGKATALVAGLLGFLEAIQTHLPGRTAEITDPLLALLVAWALRALNPRPRSGEELLPPARP